MTIERPMSGGDYVLVTAGTPDSSAIRFDSRADAEQFLRRVAVLPDDLPMLRRLASDQTGATVLDRASWDRALLRRIAGLLATGQLHILDARAARVAKRSVGAPAGLTLPVEAEPVYAAPGPSIEDDLPPYRPAAAPEKLHWIEIELVGEDDKPIPNEAYEITLPDQTVKKGRLNKDGYARIDRLKTAGDCKVCFPKLDKGAWEKIATLEER